MQGWWKILQVIIIAVLILRRPYFGSSHSFHIHLEVGVLCKLGLASNSNVKSFILAVKPRRK